MFPVTNSTLTAEALIERVLTKYELAAPIHCQFLHFGVNDTYEVCTKSDFYYLRVYRRGWRTKGQILAEVEMLEFLGKQGLSVSVGVRRTDGGFLTRIDAPEGIRYAVLFTEAPRGKAPVRTPQFMEFGKLVAELHIAMDLRPEDKRRFHIDPHHLLDEPLRIVAPLIEHREEDLRFLTKLADELKSRVSALLTRKSPEYGCIHCDIPNLHISTDGAMTLFDFDCYGYGWRAYDIAVLLWLLRWSAFRSGRPKGPDTRKWNLFLEGYGQIRPLAQSEQNAIDVFLPIRHIWLMGLQAKTITTHGRHMMSLDDDYFDANIGFVRHCAASIDVGAD